MEILEVQNPAQVAVELYELSDILHIMHIVISIAVQCWVTFYSKLEQI